MHLQISTHQIMIYTTQLKQADEHEKFVEKISYLFYEFIMQKNNLIDMSKFDEFINIMLNKGGVG